MKTINANDHIGIEAFGCARKVSIDNLTVSFSIRVQYVLVIEDVNISICPGEFVCLLGLSGCGKPSLFNCMAGFVKPTLGSISVDGEAIAGPGPDRGMVFQQHSLYPCKTVFQNIEFGPEVTCRGKGSPKNTAQTFLRMVGLSKYAEYYPHELSGGMHQGLVLHLPSLIIPNFC